MRIIGAEYLKTVVGPNDRKDCILPEICFIGRSNVGKSSLINKLAMHKIARTSSTPGATKAINLYKVRFDHGGSQKSAIFSDFPGFGYSKVARSTYLSWEQAIETYIAENRYIRRLLWVLDVRRSLDTLDAALLAWINARSLPFSVVLTKSDKESRQFTLAKKKAVAVQLLTEMVFPFSSKDGSGRKELLTHILREVE